MQANNLTAPEAGGLKIIAERKELNEKENFCIIDLRAYD